MKFKIFMVLNIYVFFLFSNNMRASDVSNNSFILEDVLVRTSEKIYSRATVKVVDGIIADIVLTKPQEKSFSSKDFYLSRGFVNSHLHPNQLLDRRLLDDLSINDLLHKMHDTHYKKTFDDRYNQALFVLIDAVKSGATSIYAVATNPAPVIKAFKELDITGAITCFFNDQWEGYGDAPQLTKLGDVEAQFQTLIEEQKDSRFFLHIGSASIQSASNELLVLFDRIAKKFNTKVNIHISEGRESVDSCIRSRGCTPVRLLKQLGVLGPNWNLIHATTIDEEEVQLIAQSGASVIHCPVSNDKTRVGIAPIYSLLKYGVNIGLGTDACSNNNTNNILHEANFAYLLHSVQHLNSDPIKEKMIFDWMMSNGYKIIGLRYGEELKVGDRADLLLWSLDSNSFIPLPYGEFSSVLINNAADLKPHTVYINGKKFIENYATLTVNEAEIKQKINLCAEKIITSITS